MRLYLAAPYAAKDLTKARSAELARIGYDVVSRWYDEPHEVNQGTTGPANALTDEQAAMHASDDLKDIDRAQAFVLLTQEQAGQHWTSLLGGGSGGRHVETGYAIARGIPVLVVGDPENIFHRLPYVQCVPTWHEAVIELASRLVDRERCAPRPMEDPVAT